MAEESWADVLEFVTRAALRGVRVAIPGRVLQVNRSEGTVAVQLELKRPRTDPELEADTDPDLVDVPVCVLSSTVAEVSIQIDVGDHGLVLFADYSLGAWRENGELTDPGPGEVHGLGGAVFLPGLWPEGEQVPIPAEGVIVGMRGGERLEVVPGEVRAGSGATDLAIRARYLDEETTFLADETTFTAALSVFTAALAALPGMAGPAGVFQAAIGVYQGKITAFQAKFAALKTTVTRVK